jgi:predicted nucleic acid-binding protein
MESEIVVVDTNIPSFIFRKDTRPALYEPHLVKRVKIISPQTYAELELLPLLNSWGEARKQRLREFLQDYVFVEADKEIAQYWAKIQFEGKKSGKSVPIADAWIAATALAYDVPLVTHNPRDFKSISGLTIITEKH